MTEKELSRYYWLKKEVEDMEERIKTFGSGVGASKIKEVMVNGSLPNSSIQEKYMKLQEIYIERRLTAIEEYLKIENYIKEVEDDEIRVIMGKRFLKLETWEQIGEELNYDRTVVAKKMRKYINNNIAHKTH